MVRRSRGFTIVEIVVVVTVIAILTAIVSLGFIQQQAKGRDSERVASARLITESLEKYYDKNGEYPSCSAITDSAANVSNNTLPGIDKGALLTPQESTSGATNSIKCSDLTSLSQADFFGYVGDGSTNCQTGNACLSFTLKYKQESQNQIASISSRRNTNIATSGTPALTATTTGFSTANISWTSVSNSTGYTVQRATDSGFTLNLVSNDYLGLNSSVSGLAYNTTYYFRVRANSGANSFSDWSPTKTISTWNLTAPTIAATTTSSTSFTASWNATANASGYITQCSSDGTTWGTGCQAGPIAATSFAFGSAAQGWKYYVRVQAVNGSYSSSWSNVASTITTINAPGAYNMNVGYMAWNNVRGSASNASCPAGTTPSYDWYYSINGANNFWVSGTQYQVVDYSAIGWNQTVSLTVATRCITGFASSGFVWANGAATRTLTGPTVSAWLESYRTAAWSATCPDGTTSAAYDWRVHGTGTVGDRSAGGVWYTSWDGTAYTWGDGNIRAAIHCYGPWGEVRADSAPGVFGSGCEPVITRGECSW